MKIKRKKYYEWDSRTKIRLIEATYPGGFMRRYARILPESETLVVFDGHDIAGWLLLAELPIGIHACVFINSRYREKGLGTKLMRYALDMFTNKNLIVADWDDASKKFFSGLKRTYGERIKIIDWWKNFDRFTKIIKHIEIDKLKQTT